jgi:hypothetical protein
MRSPERGLNAMARVNSLNRGIEPPRPHRFGPFGDVYLMRWLSQQQRTGKAAALQPAAGSHVRTRGAASSPFGAQSCFSASKSETEVVKRPTVAGTEILPRAQRSEAS